MPERTIQVGRSVEDVIEDEGAGAGLYYHALLLTDLSSELYDAGEEYSSGDNPIEQELSKRCRELREFVDSLSLTSSGALTLNRQCRRCSGAGNTSGEDPCIECDGRGFVHADEADG